MPVTITDIPAETPEQARKAIALYAIGARDVMDFLDMLGDEEPATLYCLHKMLTRDNPKHDTDTRELNTLLASLVKPVLDGKLAAS